MVRAKFRVTRIESSMASVDTGRKDERGYAVYEPRELRTIVLHPVYGSGDPNHENTKYWQYTPSGEITLGTVNERAWAAFDLDKEYYVDFTPAD